MAHADPSVEDGSAVWWQVAKKKTASPALTFCRNGVMLLRAAFVRVAPEAFVPEGFDAEQFASIAAIAGLVFIRARQIV